MTINVIFRDGSFEQDFRGKNPEESKLDMILAELRQLRGEVKDMAETLQDQVTTLTSDVTDLTSAFTDFETAVATEIATIKSSPAASDPVVAQALTNIETLTAKIKADTAAAAPAAPAAAATGDGSIQTITG